MRDYGLYFAPSDIRRQLDKNGLTASENLYHLENGKFTAFSAAEGMPKSIVRAVAQEENGDIWIGTEKDGL